MTKQRKPSREKTREGFRAVKSSYKSGHFQYYIDTRTNEKISRRQYIKRTEYVSSLEAKAKRNAQLRKERGEPPPMNRYNAIVREYKQLHPGAKVRGKGSEEFRRALRDYHTPKRNRQSNLKRVKAGMILGVIAPSLARELYPELADESYDMENLDEDYEE